MSARSIALAACVASWAAPSFAHDLEENRATLVMRESSHLSLALHVRYAEALFRALGEPGGSEGFAAFLASAAAMRPEDFAAMAARAHARLQAGTRVFVDGDAEARVTGWTWPEAALAQAMLRQQVMEAMVGDAHVHAPPVEVRADVVAAAPIADARVVFPAELGRVRLVWYRPAEQWVEPGTAGARVRFPAPSSAPATATQPRRKAR